MKSLPQLLSLPSRGTRWVVGVSGGSDSLALLVLLLEQLPGAHTRLVAAHVNYGLRGKDSDRDETFVAEFCRVRKIPLRRLRVPSLRKRSTRVKGSLQDLAREIRYGFFRKVVVREKASGVVVAHHREDQAETIMDRLLRGAGPRGLSGLREIQGLRFHPEEKPLKVWRPLLAYSKQDLQAFLRERDIRWREDVSNRSHRYRRNQIRHKVLPFLERWNPNLTENLARIGDISLAEDLLLDAMVQSLAHKLRKKSGSKEVRFRADIFQKEPLALRRRWVRLQAEELVEDARGLSFDGIQGALEVLEGKVRGPLDIGHGLLACRDGEFGFLRRSTRWTSKTHKNPRV
jgi:tRNA(Ile)-lysidine synthase